MMKKALYIWLLVWLAVGSTIGALAATPADSLSHYLLVAARENAAVQSELMRYRASQERIPQVGAYPDPELEMGVSIEQKPMFMAEFALMQMFPWFGSKGAARSEAQAMAQMAYDSYRQQRDNVWYEVKALWYRLHSLREQSKTIEANIGLLHQLEQLALVRYSSGSAVAQASASSAMPASVAPRPATSRSMSMSGSGAMAGMQGASASPVLASSGKMSSGMAGMGASAMQGASTGMADVLRVQIERAELQDQLTDIVEKTRLIEAELNTLLNRHPDTPLEVADTMMPEPLPHKTAEMMEEIRKNNPMLTMARSEVNAYHAKEKMDRLMSYPMIGVGVKYSVMAHTIEALDWRYHAGKRMLMPMLKLSLPIFRAKYRAQQRENRNMQSASEHRYSQLEQQLRLEALQVQQRLKEGERKVALYDAQHRLSLSVWGLIVQEFVAGKQPLSEVLIVERQLLDYRLKKAEAIAEYNTDVAAMDRLLSKTYQ